MIVNEKKRRTGSRDLKKAQKLVPDSLKYCFLYNYRNKVTRSSTSSLTFLS